MGSHPIQTLMYSQLSDDKETTWCPSKGELCQPKRGWIWDGQARNNQSTQSSIFTTGTSVPIFHLAVHKGCQVKIHIYEPLCLQNAHAMGRQGGVRWLRGTSLNPNPDTGWIYLIFQLSQHLIKSCCVWIPFFSIINFLNWLASFYF